MTRAGGSAGVDCIESKKYWNVTCHIAACIAVIAGSVTSSPPATGANTSPSRPSAAASRARSLPAAGASRWPVPASACACAGVLFVGVPGSSSATPSCWAWIVSSRSMAALPVAAASASRTPNTTRRVSAAAVGIGSC